MKKQGSESKRRRGRALRGALLAAAVVVAGIFLLRLGVDRFLHARYPMRYSDILLACAGEFDLPPSLVFAVAHTESSFDPEAVSNVDARGLMQIRRDTFEWVQDKMRPDPRLDYDAACFDPEVSARYGSFLLKILYDEFGSYELALCAYHAGRGNVLKWLSDPALSADGETVDTIPFSDTNWYVERVGRTREIYRRLYDIE